MVGSDGDLFGTLPAGMKIFEAVLMVSLMNFSFLCASASWGGTDVGLNVSCKTSPVCFIEI